MAENDPKKQQILDFVDKANDTMKDFEQMVMSTMAVPFVRILQQLSPQVKKDKPEYLPNAEVGFYFNTVTKEILGNTVQVIVLAYKRMYIEWIPRAKGGGLVDYHTPEHAESIAVDKTFGKWKTKDGNELKENYVYICLLAGREKESVFVLSLSSSMIKVAKEWNRLMSTHIMPNGERALPYYMIWELKTISVSKDGNDWYIPTIKFLRLLDTKEQYSLIKQEQKALPSIKIDYKQLESDTPENDSSGTNGETPTSF
jgi:hypothetical protein